MYELKTLLPEFDIKIPTCMYTMKSWALRRDVVKLPEAGNDELMRDMCKDQENVIEQLHKLQEKINALRSDLGVCGKTVELAQAGDEEPLPDIVINAHPKYIPYALLALKNLWKNSFNLEVTFYLHSTSDPLGQDAIEFQNQLSANNSSAGTRGIKITFIWKNTEHTEMISSPTMYVPIYGEVNIIRYLARVGPQAYRYEETNFSNEIDIILDICYQLLRCTTAKAAQPLLRSLNNRSEKQQYFAGDKLSIADVAVCSSIRRTPVAAKELTDNLNKWMGRVQQVTMM